MANNQGNEVNVIASATVLENDDIEVVWVNPTGERVRPGASSLVLAAVNELLEEKTLCKNGYGDRAYMYLTEVYNVGEGRSYFRIADRFMSLEQIEEHGVSPKKVAKMLRSAAKDPELLLVPKQDIKHVFDESMAEFQWALPVRWSTADIEGMSNYIVNVDETRQTVTIERRNSVTEPVTQELVDAVEAMLQKRVAC